MHKQNSVLTPPKKTLNPLIWDKSNVLLKNLKLFILRHLSKALLKEFKKPSLWISKILIIGSNTTNQYDKNSDLDIDIAVDVKKFKQHNKEYENTDFKSIKRSFHSLFSNYCEDLYFDKRQIPIHFHMTSADPKVISEGIYDVIKNKWIKDPLIVKEDFKPEEVFKKEYAFSKYLNKAVKKKLEAIYKKAENNLDLAVHEAKVLHKTLKTLRNRRFLAKPEYSGPSQSLNQDYRNVLFKLLEKENLCEIQNALMEKFSNKETEIKNIWNKTHIKFESVLPGVIKIENAFKHFNLRP